MNENSQNSSENEVLKPGEEFSFMVDPTAQTLLPPWIAFTLNVSELRPVILTSGSLNLLAMLAKRKLRLSRIKETARIGL